MPKDKWRNANAQSMARQASREFAIEGRLVSYESAQDDLGPARWRGRSNPGPRRSGSTGTRPKPTTRSRTVKPKGIGAKGTVVTIANVAVPASLADVAVGRKYNEGGRWILTSKRGVTIRDFATEADLERWWAAFQQSRGRVPRALRLGRAPKREQERSAKPLLGKNASASGVCNPAWMV